MLISVIIPIYNAEKHLEESIQSIFNQSFSDFELLLVNDGSTDRSSEICDAFALKDKRIKVFHQQNKGVSVARNLGLDHAQGEWICFVDSDDLLSTDYFEPVLTGTESDFIMVNVDVIENGVLSNFTNYLPKTMNIEEFLVSYQLYPNFAGPWSKFFKKSIIKKNKLRFLPQLRFGEDALFNLQYLKECNQCFVTNITSYCYREHEGSLSKRNFDFLHDQFLYFQLKKELRFYPDPIYYKNIISPLNRLIVSLYKDTKISARKRKTELKLILKSDFKEVIAIYKKSNLKLFICVFTRLNLYSLIDLVFLNKIKK
jgi:glycosyltransferase involved in cell wall biosynthesis